MTDNTSQTNPSQEELWINDAEKQLFTSNSDRFFQKSTATYKKPVYSIEYSSLIDLLKIMHPEEMTLSTSVEVYFSTDKAVAMTRERDWSETLYVRPLLIAIIKAKEKYHHFLHPEELHLFHAKGVHIHLEGQGNMITSSPINILAINTRLYVTHGAVGGLRWREYDAELIQKDKQQPNLTKALIKIAKQDTDPFKPVKVYEEE